MQSIRNLPAILAIGIALVLGPPAGAQLADRKALTLQGARLIMAAAEAEAVKRKWNVAIAIVDEAGDLVAFHKIDDTPVSNIAIAIAKARTAARMKRPTKALEDSVTSGRTTLLAIEGLMPLAGGVPIAVDGRTIGAVGVSGVASQDDAQVALAGIAALGVK